MNSTNSWSDWLGVGASIACAIHCAAMPFVVAFLPMLGLSFLADEGFHQVMVFVCLLIAAIAFVPGWLRHGRLLPAGIASAGLVLIATAAFALEGECCASCDTGSMVSAANLDAGQAVEDSEEACCPHCAAEASEEVLQVESVLPQETDQQTASLSIPFLSLITPLGGLLLVSAHLTNHRLSCRSDSCCSSSESCDSDVEENA